ncbi:oxidoreductase [Thermopolyspora flexuosa]|uniref:FAD/FMN-containing dehydrogenase n=1 Tax=Thermopolyspora flexuosa TaxID=103836 RepID=A0A543IYI3_9ACTN|nr:FAD-binding and (Fe-S)-binding domain-containing protein [Thermopolyspora flexuosa]TQM75636.1 FAD/FMN-containing dehydrogenase [Thermopolyspora flexuosa]GGM60837.1 oxidoreductase [Thermopolyspora flexuosa]
MPLPLCTARRRTPGRRRGASRGPRRHGGGIALTPEELARALRAAGVREVDVSARRRAEYSSDASLYRVPPAAVAFPRDAEEVAAALRVCREAGVPLTARGAGTSIAGNAVGPGLVLDFSRHMNAVRSVDPETRTAVVEPGAVLGTLQRAAAPYGLRFGPDPSTHARCTIGGMIGNNACGSRALAYGRTSDNVVELDVLAGNGEHLVLREAGDDGAAAEGTLAEVRRVMARGLAVARTEFGRFPRQISGYALEHLLPERFAPARAFVGSEGTWGVLLEARVRLVEAPAHRVLLVLGYPDMPSAADAVPALLAYRPIAIEGIDARLVGVVRTRRGGAAVPPLPRGEGWLLVEFGGATPQEAKAAAEAVRGVGALESLVLDDPGQAAAIWRIREDGAGLAARSFEGRPAHAGWEDAAVPPERLGGYLREFDELLDQHGLSGVPYGHFGDGCLHVRIDFPFHRQDGPQAFRAFLLDAARLVAAHGGSMSGEHGDGRARGELLPLMYSAEAIDLFAAVKAAFDPGDVLNPGVIVRPAPLDRDLRLSPPPVVRHPVAFRYRHDGGDLAAAVHRCTGVGKCRIPAPGAGQVMCPSYVATRDEKDTTRGRARVLQEAINGALPGGLRAPEVREVLDLCLACKGCAADCPTGVDMATYKAEVLHQSYRGRLRPLSHYSMGWLPRWSRLAALAPRAVNRLLGIGPVAAAVRRLGGIDPHRPLPRFAERPFRRSLRRARGRRGGAVAGDGPPVLLWVDSFTDHFAPDVAHAAIRVLAGAGFAVRVLDRPVCCGLTWISTGQLDAARRILGRAVAALAPYARDQVPIVALEPSCAAVLRSDAAELLDAPIPPVATLAEFLSGLPGWTPPDLSGLTVVAQPHCHHHAVLGWEADRALLARAGATVRAVGGCCGLAGNFGMERGHYEVSVAIAETQLLPAIREAGEDAVVLADGFSCRTQISQLAGVRALHLAELLADGRTAAAPARPGR